MWTTLRSWASLSKSADKRFGQSVFKEEGLNKGGNFKKRDNKFAREEKQRAEEYQGYLWSTRWKNSSFVVLKTNTVNKNFLTVIKWIHHWTETGNLKP